MISGSPPAPERAELGFAAASSITRAGCVRHLVPMGRFVPRKGFDALVRATAALLPGAYLRIPGSGEQEPNLRALTDQLGVTSTACEALPAEQADPRPFIGGWATVGDGVEPRAAGQRHTRGVGAQKAAGRVHLRSKGP